MPTLAKSAAETAAPEPAPTSDLPWWVPNWSVALGVGLYGMAFWILYTLAPAQGKEPSELFKTLASAVVLTAFVNGVVAAVFTASRDSQKKNDTIAAQAKVIAAQTPSGP